MRKSPDMHILKRALYVLRKETHEVCGKSSAYFAERVNILRKEFMIQSHDRGDLVVAHHFREEPAYLEKSPTYFAEKVYVFCGTCPSYFAERVEGVRKES